MELSTVKGPKERLWDKIKVYVGNSEGNMFTVDKATPLGGAILGLAEEISKAFPSAVEVDDKRIYIRHKLLMN